MYNLLGDIIATWFSLQQEIISAFSGVQIDEGQPVVLWG